MNPHRMACLLEKPSLQDDSCATVGVEIQELPNRRAGLTRLADHGAKAPGQHALRYPVNTNLAQVTPERAIKSRRLKSIGIDRTNNRVPSLVIDGAKSLNRPTNRPLIPIQPANRARLLRRRVSDIDTKDRSDKR
jgi:hypothetical protein